MVQEKYFVRLVKRANLFKLRNGYGARRRVSEARLTGNARQFAMHARAVAKPTGFCIALHYIFVNSNMIFRFATLQPGLKIPALRPEIDRSLQISLHATIRSYDVLLLLKFFRRSLSFKKG